MAISVHMRFQTGRDAILLYESITREMREHGEAVREGLIYHVAAVVAGGMFVADTWETRDAFTTFAVKKIIPFTERRGLNSPEVAFGDVYTIISGDGASTSGVVVVAQFDGDADELLRQYDEVSAKIRFTQAPPAGLIFHSVSTRANRVCIVDHWFSREDFERFREGALDEARHSIGMPQPRLELYDVYTTVDGRRVREERPV